MSSKNGIIGLAIGDAMGVPIEFCIREMLMENPLTEMVGGGSHGMPKGCWSDDTSMTLATIDSINRLGKIDYSDIADNFIKWMRDAEFTATDKVFGIGRTTLQALVKCELKVEVPEKTGGDGEMDNGNGSLMRILPIAYYCYYNKLDKSKIYELVKNVSSITHRHEVSVMGCYIYVLYAIELLSGISKEEAYKKIQKMDYSIFNKDTIRRYKRILNKNIAELPINEISSQGYIVSTLEATFWVLLNTENYNQAIIDAINLGNDTDTVGACVGGLAGIFYGIENINLNWKRDLIKYDYIEKLCEKFDEVIGVTKYTGD